MFGIDSWGGKRNPDEPTRGRGAYLPGTTDKAAVLHDEDKVFDIIDEALVLSQAFLSVRTLHCTLHGLPSSSLSPLLHP